MSLPTRHDSVTLQRHPPTTTGFHVSCVAAEFLIVVALGGLALAAHGHPGPFPGDVQVEREIQSVLLPHASLRTPIEGLSTLNWPIPTAITLGVIIVLFLVLRRWLDVLVAPVAAAASSIVTFEISKWVHRPRPSGHGIHILQRITTTYSFPSGHVTYAVAVFGLFFFLTTQVRHAYHPALVWAIRAVLLTVILLMPVSRILEGEHWPSDTLAGALDGLFWLVLFAHIYLWVRTRWPRLLAADER